MKLPFPLRDFGNLNTLSTEPSFLPSVPSPLEVVCQRVLHWRLLAFSVQSPLGSRAHLSEGIDTAELALNGEVELGVRMSLSPIRQVSHSVPCFFSAISCSGASVSSVFTRSSFSRPTLPRRAAVLEMFNLLQSQASVFILSSSFFIPA